MKKTLFIKKGALLGASLLALGTVTALPVAAQEDASETTSESTSTESVDEESTDEATANFLATEGSDVQLALVAAIELFQAEFPDVDIVELDIDLKKNGSFEIQIDGQDAANEFEVTIDSQTNDIKSQEQDRLDDDDDVKMALDFEQLLSIDEITSIALDDVGFGEVTDWNLEYDRDHDRFEWELEVFDQVTKDEAELTIEGLTGEILESELDD